MNRKIIISTLVAMSLAAAGSGSAFAQGWDHDNSHDQHNEHHADHGDRGHDSHDSRDHHDTRGAGPHHEFHRGQHISSQYRHKQYVVNDWRGHHLRQPPRGYHWVQTGGDFALIAVTSGLIAQIVLGN